MSHEITVKAIMSQFAFICLSVLFSLVVVVTLFGCKESSNKKVSAAPIINPSVVASVSSLQSELGDLQTAISQYQDVNKARDLTDGQLHVILTQIKSLNEQTVQSAIDNKAFSKADQQIVKLTDKLVAEGADKKQVDGVVKSALVATVVLGGIGALANTYVGVHDYSKLTKTGVASRALYGAFAATTAALATYALSEGDDAPHEAIQAVGFVVAVHAGITLGTTINQFNKLSAPRLAGRYMAVGLLTLIAAPLMTYNINLAESDLQALLSKIATFYSKLKALEPLTLSKGN